MPQEPVSLSAEVFSPDLLTFLRCLEKFEVRYLIVGGEAVIFHGYPRFTGGIDFYYAPTPSNCESLYLALEEFWDGDIPTVRSREELAEPGVIFQFGRPPHRIDLMNAIDGVGFEEAWADRVPVTIKTRPEIPTHYIGLQALLKNKRASGRAKDQDDVDDLS